VQGAPVHFQGHVCSTQTAFLFGNSQPTFEVPHARPNIVGFPEKPPVPLTPAAVSGKAATLAKGPKTSTSDRLQLRRNILATQVRDYTVADPVGNKYVLGTAGSFWSWFRHYTHMYDATGNPVALFRSPIFTLRYTWDILSYEPVCRSQKVEEFDGSLPVYKFAVLRKRLWPFLFYNHWDLHHVDCDGSLKPADLEVTSRYWFSLLDRLDVHEPHTNHIVGTFDDAAFFQLTSTMNVWFAKGLDKLLAAATAVLIDIHDTHKLMGMAYFLFASH